ncbi:MAG: cytochrome b/b6 domain-containing protein [Thermoanaerobaculia bacterium]
MDRSRVRIWDLVVRSFHWLMVASFLTAFLIATLSDDDGTVFPLHALFGLTVVFMVVLRIVWGLIGSRWARFGSFELRPSRLFAYFRGIAGAGPAVESSGHNPATSWFAISAVLIFLLLGVSGFMNGSGNEAAEEVHEVLAWTMLILAGGHIAGVLVHTIRTHENITLSMVTGMKNADRSAAIESPRPWSAVLFVGLVAIWVALLVRGYDQATRKLTIPVLGVTLELSEAEDEAGNARGEDEEERD